MKIENIVNVSEYLGIRGLSNPALEVLNPTEESYRALLFQPAGPFLGDAARIGPLDLDFADQQATQLLEMAVKGGQEFDIVAEWGRKLAAAALDAVLDRPARTTLVEQIGAGDARRVAISRRPLTLHQADMPLHGTWLAKLRIEKFRPVHDGKSPFEFGQVTLITGPNGTGKTSLLEAIEYFYCGQNRRHGNSSSKVFGTLCGSKLEMASTSDSTRLRARCLKWYNREERTSSGVLDGFDRYNFLDTDAAYRVTSELNAAALPEDLSRLVVGPEASQVWAYIGKLPSAKKSMQPSSEFTLRMSTSTLVTDKYCSGRVSPRRLGHWTELALVSARHLRCQSFWLSIGPPPMHRQLY